MADGEVKRQNFNVTPEEESHLQQLREVLSAPSVKAVPAPRWKYLAPKEAPSNDSSS